MLTARLGMVGAITGIFLNRFVVFVNNGKMPTFLLDHNEIHAFDAHYTVADHSTILPLWGDWIEVKALFGDLADIEGVFQVSLGDVLMYAGVGMSVIATSLAIILLIAEMLRNKKFDSLSLD